MKKLFPLLILGLMLFSACQNQGDTDANGSGLDAILNGDAENASGEEVTDIEYEVPVIEEPTHAPDPSLLAPSADE